MIQRSFIHAMLHTRKQGEHLASFREQLRGLTLEDRQWFTEQFAREFDIEIVSTPTVQSTSTALAIIAQPVIQPITFVKGYVNEELQTGGEVGHEPRAGESYTRSDGDGESETANVGMDWHRFDSCAVVDDVCCG